MNSGYTARPRLEIYIYKIKAENKYLLVFLNFELLLLWSSEVPLKAMYKWAAWGWLRGLFSAGYPLLKIHCQGTQSEGLEDGRVNLGRIKPPN